VAPGEEVEEKHGGKKARELHSCVCMEGTRWGGKEKKGIAQTPWVKKGQGLILTGEAETWGGKQGGDDGKFLLRKTGLVSIKLLYRGIVTFAWEQEDE